MAANLLTINFIAISQLKVWLGYTCKCGSHSDTHMMSSDNVICIVYLCLAYNLTHAYTLFGDEHLWWFSYPGLLLHTESLLCHSTVVEACLYLVLYCVGVLNPLRVGSSSW